MTIEYNSELVEAARRRDNDDPSFYADLCRDHGEGTYYPDEVTKVVVKIDEHDSLFDDDIDGDFANGAGEWMWVSDRYRGGAASVLDDADKRHLAKSALMQKIYDDYSQEDIADELSGMGDRDIVGLFDNPYHFNEALEEAGIDGVKVILWQGDSQSDWGDVLVKGNIELAKDKMSHWDDTLYTIDLYRAPDVDCAARDWYELVYSMDGFM